MESIYGQFISFLITVGIGLLAGILFDIYSVIRGLWKPRQFGTCLGDLIFWVIMTIAVFILLLIGNWADLRIYVFLGIVIGYFLYLKKISLKFKYYFRKFLVLILQVIGYLWQGFSWPFKIIAKVVVIPFGFIVTGFMGVADFVKKTFRKTGIKFKNTFIKIFRKKRNR